jgi:hypothetical protein
LSALVLFNTRYYCGEIVSTRTIFWRDYQVNPAIVKEFFDNILSKWNMLVYFTAIWYHLCPFGIVDSRLGSFGIFFPFWYVWNKKNLAALPWK